MKKLFFLVLSLSALTLSFTSCEKEIYNDSSSSGYFDDQSFNHSNVREGDSVGPVIELGEIISTSEGVSRVNAWKSEFPLMEYNGHLKNVFYHSLNSTQGAHGLGFSFNDVFGLVAFAVDENNRPITSKYYLLNGMDGVGISSQNALDTIMSLNNEDGDFPTIQTFGFNLLDNIIEQSGAQGLSFSNALDDQGNGTSILELSVRAYDTSNLDFGDTGGASEAGCVIWSIHGPSPCTWSQTIAWIIMQAL